MNTELHMLSSPPRPTGQFFPSLQPFRSLQTQPQSRRSRDSNMLPPTAIHPNPYFPSEGGYDHLHAKSLEATTNNNNNHPHVRNNIFSHDDSERAVGGGAGGVCGAGVTHKPTMGSPADKKKDRKSQARRYLVEGLNSPHYGNGLRGLHRSNTFNHPQSTALHPGRFPLQHSMNTKYSRGDDSNNNNFLNFTSGIRNMRNEDTSKVKRAIDNWNELVLEMNSEQCRRLSNVNDYISAGSDSSSNEDCPSPLHRHRKPLYLSSQSIFPKKSPEGGATTKSNPFSHGLSFARYRPITPGLLLDLEKNKLSSRKKTQRWINQLEVQSRSYSNNNNSPSKIAQKERSETNPDPLGECKIHNGTVSTPGVKTLHRTESYGSTRTRLSSIPAHSRKQHSDFL